MNGTAQLLGEDYAILEMIGHGANGVIFKALQHSLDRHVAVKVLQSDLLTDPEFRDRFELEAKSIAKLTGGDHIVHVYDFRQRADQLAIIMQYVDGGALSARMRGDGLPGPEVLRIARAVAKAIDYAHRRGTLHRDIKPHNVLLQDDGDGVWLADFGLVKLVDGTALTRTRNQLMGTYPYMAPELLRGEPATTASDLYAFAATIYQVLTGGSYPFPGGAGERARNAQRRQGPPLGLLPRDQSAAAALEIFGRALSPDPSKRQPSARQLVDELDAALTTEAAARVPVFTQDLETPPLASWDIGEDLDDDETLLDVAPEPPEQDESDPAPETDGSTVAAPHADLEPPADVDVDEPEPVASPTPRPRRSRKPLVLAAAAALSAAAAGVLLLPDQEPDQGPTATPATRTATLRAGAASIQAASGTAPSSEIKAIAARAFPGLQPAELTGAGTAANGLALALINTGTTQLTPASTTRGRTVTIAGGRARRYQRGDITTVLAQTPDQVVRLECTRPGDPCERAITTLALGEEQLEADPLSTVNDALRTALQDPRGSRSRLPLPRRDLTSRGTRARSIAAAYRQARDRVVAIAKTRPRDRDLPALADRLGAVASAYGELANAAGNRSEPGDRRGRRALATADEQLRSSRAILLSRGYTPLWPSTAAPAAAVIERRQPTAATSTSTTNSADAVGTGTGTQAGSSSTTQQSAPRAGTGSSSSSSASSGGSGGSGGSFCDTGPC